jgi:hypothetical protein
MGFRGRGWLEWGVSFLGVRIWTVEVGSGRRSGLDEGLRALRHDGLPRSCIPDR